MTAANQLFPFNELYFYNFFSLDKSEDNTIYKKRNLKTIALTKLNNLFTVTN